MRTAAFDLVPTCLGLVVLVGCGEVMKPGQGDAGETDAAPDAYALPLACSESQGCSGPAVDSSGNGRTGAYSRIRPGKVGALTGDVDTAVQFDDGSLTVDDHPSLNGASVSVEAWIFVAELEASRFDNVFIKTSSDDWNDGYGLWIRGSNGTMEWWTNGYGASPVSDRRVALVDYTPYLGGWHHVVGTDDGNTAKLYIDGEAVATQTNPAAIRHAADPLSLGAGQGSTGFRGIIDEAAIYDVVLTEQQVDAHYRAQADGSYMTTILNDHPAAYWRLGERS